MAPALVRFARDAAPLTVAALVLLLGLYIVVPEAGAAPPMLLALYLVLVSALTLPHVVVVSFMDVRRGLWRDSHQPSAEILELKDQSATRSARCAVLFLLALLALLCVLVLGCSSRFVSDQPGGEEAGVTVSRVTDGDTVRITPEIGGEDRVRLIGVDTPETGPERGPEPYGEEAARFTQRSLEDQNVSLEFDVEREDDYGRLLAYVYLPDGSMFNETLLREGYAQVATFPPNTRYLDRFEDAQEEAREASRGIWGLPEGELCRLRDRGNGIGDC